ncbi:unknown protein [Leptolyngbya sp. NIES-3755]|nr:unknown protein [Leptolyngbya sp. NIES-3755]
MTRSQFEITRGCLVRSKDKLLNSHFRKTHLEPLIEEGGEFVELIEQQIKPLVAIRSVYQKRESEYRVTEEQVSQFIREKGDRYWLGVHNPLLKEILSEPSYEVPDDIETEPECSEEFDADVSTTDDLEELVHA